MRDYRRTTGKYVLPDAVYHQVLWQIRDYYRLKSEAEAIIEETGSTIGDGMPHGSPSPDGVFNKVQRRIDLLRIVDMVDKEMAMIPREYQQGVWRNILYRTAFPMDADRSTYARYKSRMIYNIAERQGLI